MPKHKISLLVIVGPTGSGKTDLAIKAANIFNGELISADSRSVYKGMDIGTAKPDSNDLGDVKIWGIDLIEPNDKYSVYEFQKYAYEKIKEIQNRDKLPILVGGSGMYIDSVILNYQFINDKNTIQAVELDNMSMDELYEYCDKNNVTLPENYKNRRHLISAISSNGNKSTRASAPKDGTLVLGLDLDKSELDVRLRHRAELMVQRGIINEANSLASKYGWNCESMKGNVYSLLKNYTDGDFSHAEFIERIVSLDKKLAKKQRTWFKRNNFIQWLKPSEALHFLSNEVDY